MSDFGDAMIDYGPLIEPPPDMKPCSPAMRAHILSSYRTYHARSQKRVKAVRTASLVLFGLLAIGVTYVTVHRLFGKVNPAEMAYPTIPHRGIPPKPPNIQQQRDDLPRPAIQKWQYVPRRAPRMHQKLPNGIELLREPLPPPARPAAWVGNASAALSSIAGLVGVTPPGD
jgi:hypothetical protein